MTSDFKTPENRRAVLVVTPYYAAHGENIERIAGQLISEISVNDHFHFTWIASGCNPAPHINGQFALPMKGTNILERLMGFLWPIWSPRSLRQLRHAVEGVDLVWLHETKTLGSLAAFSMARKLKKPILLTQHDRAIAHPHFLRRFVTKLIDRFVTQKLLKQTERVTFTGDTAGEFYYQRIAFASPVKIIPNGVDLRIFHPALKEKRSYLRARFALRCDQPVMLFVGRFTTPNGLDVIHQMAKLLPDWRFWLAGQGPQNPEKWFLPNVQTFRNRSDESLAELYQAADLLILPGYGSEFPLSIQEAMACGLPVMCSPVFAAGNQLAKPHLIAFKVEPGSPERTAKLWATKLLQDKERIILSEPQMKLADAAQSLWEWPKIAGYYSDVLEGLCKKTGS